MVISSRRQKSSTLPSRSAAPSRQHVYFHAVCHHLGIGNAELQLICGNILFHIYFSRSRIWEGLWLDTPKCRTFPEDSSRSKASATSLRLHKGHPACAGAERPDILSEDASESIHRFQDMFFGQSYITPGHNAAFGLDKYPVLQRRFPCRYFPNISSHFPRPLDIGMVKKYGAHIHSLCNIVIRFLLLQSPCAYSQLPPPEPSGRFFPRFIVFIIALPSLEAALFRPLFFYSTLLFMQSKSYYLVFSCLIMVENSPMERIHQCHCPFTAAFAPIRTDTGVVRPPFLFWA